MILIVDYLIASKVFKPFELLQEKIGLLEIMKWQFHFLILQFGQDVLLLLYITEFLT